MQFFFTLFIVLAFIAAVASAKSTEEDDEALRDLYTGMAGLKEAASNPQMLAQLMRDLQVSDTIWKKGSFRVPLLNLTWAVLFLVYFFFSLRHG